MKEGSIGTFPLRSHTSVNHRNYVNIDAKVKRQSYEVEGIKAIGTFLVYLMLLDFV